MSRKVEAALGETFLHSVRGVRAMTYWSPAYGHGLKIIVKAPGHPGTYARDLVSEMNGAATVLAALVGNETSVDWDFVEVQYFIEYGAIPPRSKPVVGVAEVLIPQETMLWLHDQQTPVAEYPEHWQFLRGFKDQPDSDELLVW